MLSTCNAPVEEQVLDAAATCVVDFGFARVTLAEIARRAGVSRPTIYRRWPDTASVLASLLTQRITEAAEQIPAQGPSRQHLVQRILTVMELLRRDPVIMSVLRTAPEVAVVYITQRLGTSQHLLIDALEAGISRGQQHGSIRAGNPRHLAVTVLLTAQSALQSGSLVETILESDDLAEELDYMLNGYLAS